MVRIACDTHSHTIFSRHAFSTLQENVHAAALVGLDALGTTDHFSSLITREADYERAHGYDSRDFQHFLNYPTLPKTWEGVRILRACEVDIADMDGHIFGHNVQVTYGISGGVYKHPRILEDMVVSQCDYVLASLHNLDIARGASKDEVTRMYMHVLDNPKVFILGHLGRYGVEFNIRELVRYARDCNKCIEINEATLAEYKNTSCKEIARVCAEEGTMIVTGSDSHFSGDIGKFPHVEAMLDEIDFPQELIATSDGKTLTACLKKALG